MRVEREVLQKSLRFLQDEGALIVTSPPRAGLTLLLSQIGSYMLREVGCDIYYQNCAMPGVSLQGSLGERFSLPLDHLYPSLIGYLKQAGPTLLIMDGLERIRKDEQDDFYAFLDLLEAERLFDASLKNAYVVVGTCGASARTRINLGFFTRAEVAALMCRQSGDQVALAVHAWSAGSPEVAHELARDLLLREVNVQDVYRTVRKSAQHGRLGMLISKKPTAHQLWREGLMRLSEKGRLVPIPAVALAKKVSQLHEVGLSINKATREVRYSGRLVPLFPRENQILCLLASSPGCVFTPAQIYSEISGGDLLYRGDSSVKAQVSRLRSKLPCDEQWILTRRGFGYCFNPCVSVTVI